MNLLPLRHWLTRSIARKLAVSFFSVFLLTYLATALVVLSAVHNAVTEAELDALAQKARLQLGDTGFHVQRVQHFTEAVALEMGLDREAAAHMGVMSILHDVGKLYIPDAILKKPARLTAEEWAVMKEHPGHGVRILGDNPFYELAREIAGGHHENWDGSGYPRGLAGEGIPLSARIVKATDVFDALTSRRPYKEPWPLHQALGLLRDERGRQFDPRVVDAFLRAEVAGVIGAIMARFE